MPERQGEQERIVVMVPEVSDNQIGADLVWLTEHLMKTQGAKTSGGFLGGEYGYGAHHDNHVFSMHPYCWCERSDCPWCWGCVCPEEAYIYEVAGQRVDHDAWLAEYDRSGNARRSTRKDESLACDYCLGERVLAPNFLHKPSGTTVHWYKYIGRGMRVDLRADWRAVLRECVDSLPSTPPGDEGHRG